MIRNNYCIFYAFLKINTCTFLGDEMKINEIK